ncbi:MAG: SDR family oxidoreductase [Dongiaceae bacterium]
MASNSERVAIVTGGGTGIGRAVALHLAARGWRIGVNYAHSREAAEATAADCTTAGGEGLALPGDIALDSDCRRIVAATIERWDRLDSLVNNAGVTAFAPASDLDALDATDFTRIFSVNVTAAYQMARAAAPALREARGAIVNMSSHGAFSGLGSSMAYAASKGALNTLTLALARALAPEIRVNAVCPGFVDTDWVRRRMTAEAYDDFRARVARMTPLGRMSDAADVAEAVGWFLQGGPTITGQLLVVDGGVHLTVRTPRCCPN